MKKRVQSYILLLGQVLGQGSFGIVYKGYHQKTGQEVAIKALNKKKIEVNEYVREALRLEIKILRRIESQSIVRFKDVIETANNYYIIQQYCNGGDFGSYLKKHKKLSEHDSIEFMIQILKGFCKLIRQGIVHRDMKPENILIHNGKLKIADFGLAKPTHSSNFLESNVGTPMYQSPQLLASEKYTYKCDVWALGIIFYYMLYHKHPWRAGANHITHLQNIRTQKIDFPQEVPVSKETKKFILKCLEVEEEKRADWEQIFSSCIFEGKLPKYEKLNESYLYTVTKLRNSIHESNIDMKRFFKGQKIMKGSSLKMIEFSLMIKKLTSSISDAEIQYMFTQFDRDRNGKITFDEFEKCLQENEINLELNRNKQLKKVLSWVIEDQIDKKEIEMQEKWNSLEERLKVSLQEKEIYDLYELFIKFDADEGGSLEFVEMSCMLKKILPSISEDEVKLIFQRFDQNGDKKISMKQFYKNMSQVVGTPCIHGDIRKTANF